MGVCEPGIVIQFCQVKPSEEASLWKDRRLALQLRLWASFRGQTLARTVEGMMLNEHALRLLASWEGLSGEALESLVRQKFSCAPFADSNFSVLIPPTGRAPSHRCDQGMSCNLELPPAVWFLTHAFRGLFIRYTVSCQAYGQHKRNRDPKAADTEWLLQRFPNLRVAYVDKASSLSTVHDDHGGSVLKESLRQLGGAMSKLQGAAPESSAGAASATLATFGDAPASLLGHMSDTELDGLVKRVRERLK